MQARGFGFVSCVLAVGMFESTTGKGTQGSDRVSGFFLRFRGAHVESTTCHDDCESNTLAPSHLMARGNGQTGHGTPGSDRVSGFFLRFGGWHV